MLDKFFCAVALWSMAATAAAADDRLAPMLVYPPAVPLHSYPGYPGLEGYSEEPDAVPTTMMRMHYQGGLTVYAGTTRNSRVPIGGLVRFAYEFRHNKELVVDLSAVAQGLFGEQSALKLRYPDEPKRCIRMSSRSNGDEVIERVEIELQHFMLPTTKPEIAFSVRFRYAHEKVDGVLNFLTVTSPVLKVTAVRSGDRSVDWRYGDFPPMPVRYSTPAVVFLAAGVGLICYELLFGVLLLKQKYLPGRARNDVQAAVATYRRIAGASKASGVLSRVQVTELADAFRTAFGARTVTGAAIDQRFAGHRKQRSICAVLKLLDAASVDGSRTIGGAEREQLFADMAEALGDR